MKKVYRILISETQTFYHDVEAEDEDQARDIAYSQVIGPDATEDPIEDASGYTGYVIDSVSEIDRENADLSPHEFRPAVAR